MGKDIFKKLERISIALPPAFRYEQRGQMGSEILKVNPKAECDGKPLLPGKKYVVKVGVPVNHFKCLKRIYSSRGNKGVEEYVRSFAPEALPITN